MPREREDEDNGERKNLLSDWITVRNSCSETQIYRTDSRYAAELGFPTLAALCDVLDRISKARGRIEPRVIEAELRPVLSIAIGEARERLRIGCNNEWLELPGIATIPGKLLEREVMLNPEAREIKPMAEEEQAVGRAAGVEQRTAEPVPLDTLAEEYRTLQARGVDDARMQQLRTTIEQAIRAEQKALWRKYDRVNEASIMQTIEDPREELESITKRETEIAGIREMLAQDTHREYLAVPYEEAQDEAESESTGMKI